MDESNKPPKQPKPSTPEHFFSAQDLHALIAGSAADQAQEVNRVDPKRDLSELENKTLETEGLRIENDRLRDERDRARDVHNWRKWTLPALFALTIFWLSVVVWFVWLSATRGTLEDAQRYDGVVSSWTFKITDKVIIAFITSTTVSVIGIFLVAARWLFRAPQKPEPKDDE